MFNPIKTKIALLMLKKIKDQVKWVVYLLYDDNNDQYFKGRSPNYPPYKKKAQPQLILTLIRTTVSINLNLERKVKEFLRNARMHD